MDENGCIKKGGFVCYDDGMPEVVIIDCEFEHIYAPILYTDMSAFIGNNTFQDIRIGTVCSWGIEHAFYLKDDAESVTLE